MAPGIEHPHAQRAFNVAVALAMLLVCIGAGLCVGVASGWFDRRGALSLAAVFLPSLATMIALATAAWRSHQR